MDPAEVCAYLGRTDKWFVSGGSSSVYAPPHPQWDRVPGFWDDVHLGKQALPRLFTLLLLDDEGRPLETRFEQRHWQPDRLHQTYTASGLELVEERVNLRPDVFVSRFRFRNLEQRARTLHAVAWSWQPRLEEGPCLEACETHPRGLLYTLRLPDQPLYNLHPRLNLYCLLAGERPPDSFSVNPSEGHGPGPEYRYSTCREKFQDGRLAGEMKVEGGVCATRSGPTFAAGTVHMALHYRIELPPAGEASLSVGAALGFAREQALQGAVAVSGDAPERSAEAWEEHFAGVPSFTCSDPYLQKYYWYRWYQIRAHQVDMRFGGFQHPCVLEGIGMFRQHISYSAHCHMRECGWMHDPRFAAGSLENMLANQYEDGSFPGHINERGVAGTAGSITGRVSFYHANWGNIRHLYQLHGDRDFLSRAYRGLTRYLDYFERERDPEQSFVYDVVNQGETGQEYMPRYQVVNPHADDWGPIRLKGVDSSFYIRELLVAMASAARELGRPAGEVDRWEDWEARVRQAIRERMWDPETEMFCDLDPEGMRRTQVKSALCFYPFMTDLAEPRHLAAIHRHLLDSAEFWTPWPFPSTSADDPMFSAEAEWKGKRTNCPWNGRTWPMTNSHLCEALAEASQRLDPSLGPAAVTALRCFVELMFFDHDPERPNTWEHYNPYTGAPCDYRGVDDYQHSWVVDLMLRYLVGIQPQDDGSVVVNPLPSDLELAVEKVRVKGRWFAVSCTAEGMRVSVDGELVHQAAQRERVVIPAVAGA